VKGGRRQEEEEEEEEKEEEEERGKMAWTHFFPFLPCLRRSQQFSGPSRRIWQQSPQPQHRCQKEGEEEEEGGEEETKGEEVVVEEGRE